jgi:hypothetical protein
LVRDDVETEGDEAVARLLRAGDGPRTINPTDNDILEAMRRLRLKNKSELQGARLRLTKEKNWRLNKKHFAEWVVIYSREFETEKTHRDELAAQKRR